MSSSAFAPNDCPQPPGIRAKLSTLILHEACQTAGGVLNLAHLLQAPAALVQRWLDGEVEAPREVYQLCIDIVLLHEPDAGLSARRGSDSLRSTGN
jgi:hypothetical protein